MSGLEDHNYTSLPNGVNTPSSARIVSVEESSRASQEQEKKPRDISKLANLSLVVALVFFIGSIAFAIQRSQTSTNTRAGSNDSLQEAASLGPDHLLQRDYVITETFTTLPKKFEDKVIPEAIMADAKKEYPTADEKALNNYVINRVVMFYIITAELKKKGVTYPAILNSDSFSSIENNFSALKKLALDNLISTATYDYIQIHFANQLNKDQLAEQYGDLETIRAKAEELAQKYDDQAKANPADFMKVLQEAKLDPVVSDFNNYDLAGYQVKDYYSDLNDVYDQSEYVFDKDFDSMLYSLTPGQVSDVITLNKEVPYMYIIVYPEKITKRDYQSFKELVTQYSSSFTQ